MNEIDEKIIRALDAEDRALLEQLDEQGLIAQSFSVFRGPQGWIAVIATVAIFALFAGAVYSASNFLNAAEPVDTLRWGAAAWFLMTMVAFMKVWFWMRMESNRVIREVKRVELQLARLQEKSAV